MKKVLIVLVVLLVICAGVGFLVPPTYDIERSVTINAPPEAVHAWVGDLKKWPEWAPWHEEDPTIKVTYGDKTTGVGARQSWTGEDGDGELIFTKSSPADGIVYDMAFISEDTRVPALSAMTYHKVAGGTEVRWQMEGSWKGAVPGVMAGWMKLFTPMMVGGMFDKGLEKLKGKVEGGA